MKKHLVWLMAVTLLGGCDLDLSGLGSCVYEESWTETISASGISSLRILADAGHLRIEGRRGTNSIRVRATACADDRSTLDEIDFDMYGFGSTVEIETDVSLRDNARLDLVIEVPEDMAAAIFHSEGNVEIRDIEVVYIDDESGHIDIHNIAFDVDIEDDSGEIDIHNVGGDVAIEDGSGDIDVEDVGGDLIVFYDASGSIRYHNIRGRIDLP